MSNSCATCRFWDRYADGGEHSLSRDKGDCRRRSPLISETLLEQTMPGRGIPLADIELELAIYPASAFPVTHETTWCGDFQSSRSEMPIC